MSQGKACLQEITFILKSGMVWQWRKPHLQGPWCRKSMGAHDRWQSHLAGAQREDGEKQQRGCRRGGTWLCCALVSSLGRVVL